MKIIPRIFILLFVIFFVAGTAYVIVEETSLISNEEIGREQPPAFTDSGEQPMQQPEQPMGRPEGDFREINPGTRGLSNMLIMVAKLAGITIVVLLVQKGINLLVNRRLKLSQNQAEIN